MKYVMKDGTDIKVKINNILDNAEESQFEKYMPKEPEPEKVKEFDNPDIKQLIKECGWVEKYGGYQIIAMRHGVDIDLVKEIEQAVIQKKNERFPDPISEV